MESTHTRLSGITPSGRAHLGNYLGAIRHWARTGDARDLYFVSNLHGMTNPYNPSTLRSLTTHNHAVLIASGIPAEQVFVQSDLFAEHASLTWLLECVCTFGEASRMTQFKEKSRGQDGVRLGLLTYPVLMAADILLHGAKEIPVGDDQRQHVEIARALARRFNSTYGDVFVVPEAVVPPAAARVMDLAAPQRKMAKSTESSAGIVFVLDQPELIRRKINRAVTDDLGSVAYRPDRQPGVANLLEILGAATDTDPSTIELPSYAALKSEAADAVVALLDPVRKRTEDLLADPAELARMRKRAADAARAAAVDRLSAAKRMAGVD